MHVAMGCGWPVIGAAAETVTEPVSEAGLHVTVNELVAGTAVAPKVSTSVIVSDVAELLKFKAVERYAPVTPVGRPVGPLRDPVPVPAPIEDTVTR